MSYNHKSYILHIKSDSGFTIIEMLVVIFCFALIIIGLLSLYSGIFRINSQQGGLLSDADQARKLAFQIATEIRDGQTGANGAYVLDTAQDQQIIYYSPNADNDTAVERVRYYVQNAKLYKGVTKYNGASYNTSTEITSLVQSDLANGNNPVFYYYDDTYTGSAAQNPLSQPVNIALVKFVKVSLQIYNKAGVKNTNTYTVTASGAIRNLKTNLGN